ncbi:MAG: cell division topological specificity factor MinE [Clostridium sp.]
MDILKFFSKQSPKETATNRLKLILIHDRTNLSPDFLEKIKKDILDVISKYAEIEDEEIEVKLTTTQEIENSFPALIASIPIKRMKV